MEKSVKIKWGVVITLFIFCLYLFKQRDKEEGRIKQGHNLYCGTILSIGKGKGGYIINYEFVAEGKVIKGNTGCTKKTDARFKDGSKSILVVTDKNNPSINRLLESSSDFEKFNISPSDTLGLSCLYD